ncbi:MAG TPA: metallophosphoesterase family protein [Spirochaetales bacterium]|nr:metallophosphoesterase family protein [Spirochaetales bacterium]
MRILVVSDTHGELGALAAVLSKLGERADLLVHCGDGAEDAERAKSLGLPCPPVVAVRGNVDLDRRLPASRSLSVDGIPILILHGNAWLDGAGSLLPLALHGAEKGAALVLFGHTHHPALADAGGLVLVNPGSLSRPRGGRGKSFALLRVDPGPGPTRDRVEALFYEVAGTSLRSFDPRD